MAPFPTLHPLSGLSLPHSLMVRRKEEEGCKLKMVGAENKTKRRTPSSMEGSVVHVINKIEGAGEINTNSMSESGSRNEDRGEESAAGHVVQDCLERWKPIASGYLL